MGFTSHTIPVNSSQVEMSTEDDNWANPDELKRAELTVEEEVREAACVLNERRQRNRKRARTVHQQTNLEEAALRHQMRREQERVDNFTPAIIYLPNGMAE